MAGVARGELTAESMSIDSFLSLNSFCVVERAAIAFQWINRGQPGMIWDTYSEPEREEGRYISARLIH